MVVPVSVGRKAIIEGDLYKLHGASECMPSSRGLRNESRRRVDWQDHPQARTGFGLEAKIMLPLVIRFCLAALRRSLALFELEGATGAAAATRRRPQAIHRPRPENIVSSAIHLTFTGPGQVSINPSKPALECNLAERVRSSDLEHAIRVGAMRRIAQ